MYFSKHINDLLGKGRVRVHMNNLKLGWQSHKSDKYIDQKVLHNLVYRDLVMVYSALGNFSISVQS